MNDARPTLGDAAGGVRETIEEDSVETGRRLVRARGQGGISLSERLTNGFYRLTWRTPFQSMLLRGRHPIKLLVAPVDPIAGNKANGEAMLEGHVAHWSHLEVIKDSDFSESSASAGLRDHLQSFR
jgi:hypothetical protein